ncbi:MAG: methyltransferase domain-containing protein [Nanoarchaeota archaeon]|nr:methyltransferase domain-containing protein [Nanoarchaeota archaeon]
MPKKSISWDVVAEEYSSYVEDKGDIYHLTYLNPVIFKLLGNVKNKKILDLACGNGYFSMKLAKKQALVTGVDYSEKLIDIAKSKTKSNVKFFVGDSSKMTFLKNNSFNFVVANMAFHDIMKIKGTVKECARVLKKNSKLIFSIPHPAFHSAKRKKQGKEYYKEIKRYLSLFSRQHPKFKDVMYYHRSIGYYLKLLFKQGFVVSAFHEIAIKHAKGKSIKDTNLLSHKQEIPTFLIVEATLK